MTHVAQAPAPLPEARESIIEEAATTAPSALSIIQKIDIELAAIDDQEEYVGRVTSGTRYRRQELLRKRTNLERLVN